jgi:hypothetical protein
VILGALEIAEIDSVKVVADLVRITDRRGRSSRSQIGQKIQMTNMEFTTLKGPSHSLNIY